MPVLYVYTYTQERRIRSSLRKLRRALGRVHRALFRFRRLITATSSFWLLRLTYRGIHELLGDIEVAADTVYDNLSPAFEEV